MWTWHGKAYLGAAHGVAGILYMLLHVPSVTQDAHWQPLITATIDRLSGLKSEEGNFPGKCGESSAHLIHFCHGAPGFVWLFCKAYAVLGEARFLKEARAAGELVWRCGLLKKGPGLCHGISGNGYALVTLFKATGDATWLARAMHFASSMLEEEMLALQSIPDNPFSLFEGKAGALCLLLDLRSNPGTAALPLFELGGLGGLTAGGSGG